MNAPSRLPSALAVVFLVACGTSEEQLASYGGTDSGPDAVSATGGASGSGGGAASGGNVGAGGAPKDGGAGTDAAIDAGADGRLDARADACDVGCTPRGPSAACQASAVLWDCTARFDFQAMTDGGCVDAGTALVRYCCPATFLPECR